MHRHYADQCGRLTQVTTAFSNQIHSWRIWSAYFHEICEYRSRLDWDSVLEMDKDKHMFWPIRPKNEFRSHFCQTDRMNVVYFKCGCHSRTVSVCMFCSLCGQNRTVCWFLCDCVAHLHSFILNSFIIFVWHRFVSFSNQNYPKRLEIHFTCTITCCNVILMCFLSLLYFGIVLSWLRQIFNIFFLV